MHPIVWILLGVVLLVGGLLLEGWRQGRAMRRRGQEPSKNPTGALGAGVLELQKILQPDRDVETISEELKGERQHPEYRPGATGDDSGDD